ncbi:MAG: zinc ribbon domain-containing protein [Planctomycetota bacterium]
MPTYDYECPKCNHKFEHFQGINDPVLKQCPKCRRTGLRRLIGSGSALIFKGSGFYITDYCKQSVSYTDAKKKDGPPAPVTKPETKTTAKSETKMDKPAPKESKKSSDTKPKK